MRGRTTGFFFRAILALIGVAGCGLTGPTITPMPLGPQLPDAATTSAALPAWAPGDSWTFDGQNERGPYTYRLSVLGEETFEGQATYKVQSPSYVYWYAKSGLGFLARAKDGMVVRRVKPAQSFEWPLAVGKTWVRDVEFTDTESGNQRYTYTDVWKVEGYEEVKVPAGTFKAFKVVRKTGNAFSEFWYSPQVKYHVRMRGWSRVGGYDEVLVAHTAK